MIPRSSPEFHEGDFGTVFEFEVRNQSKELLDLSDALITEVVFMRPDGSSFARAGTLNGFSGDESSSGSVGSIGVLPGADGVFFYVIQPGDFDTSGNWFVQAYIELDGGAWNSSVHHFVVFPNLINISGEVLTP